MRDLLRNTSSRTAFSFWRRKLLIEGALFLNLSDDLRLDHLSATVNALVVHVVSTQVVSCCPLCGQASDQIPSRYLRVVADGPCGNRPVRLH